MTLRLHDGMACGVVGWVIDPASSNRWVDDPAYGPVKSYSFGQISHALYDMGGDRWRSM
jgi:hypothetical protein